MGHRAQPLRNLSLFKYIHRRTRQSLCRKLERLRVFTLNSDRGFHRYKMVREILPQNRRNFGLRAPRKTLWRLG